MARKRGNNEGSIHRLPSGSFRAQVSLQGQRLSFTAPTRSQCQDWLKKTLNQIDNGLTLSGAQTTLELFLSHWLESIQLSLRPGTFYQYEMTCRKHVVPTLGSVRLKDLQPDRIQKLYIQKTQEGCGVRTIKMIHSVLHSSLKMAVKHGMLSRNPADAVTPPRYEHEEMQFYDESQVNQFLFAAKGNRNEALYYLAVTTGLRQSELLGLKWSDLDWVKKTLTVQRQLRRGFRNNDYFTAPKTKAGKRTIKLGEKAIEILHEHWDVQTEERRLAGNRWKENDLIFTSSIGTPMDQHNLYRVFREFITSIGLPSIRFHDLRHTAATLMLNHGIAPIIVSKRLGHSKVSITLDIYGHLMSEMQSEAADLMDELITSVPIDLKPVAHGCTRQDDGTKKAD